MSSLLRSSRLHICCRSTTPTPPLTSHDLYRPGSGMLSAFCGVVYDEWHSQRYTTLYQIPVLYNGVVACFMRQFVADVRCALCRHNIFHRTPSNVVDTLRVGGQLWYCQNYFWRGSVAVGVTLYILPRRYQYGVLYLSALMQTAG